MTFIFIFYPVSCPAPIQYPAPIPRPIPSLIPSPYGFGGRERAEIRGRDTRHGLGGRDTVPYVTGSGAERPF
jgi:hypothetical protein